MLVPAIERFAEFGWQCFVDPAETYEFFLVTGTFKRAKVESKEHVIKFGAKTLVQRNALFDVCLHSGLAQVIVAYIQAEDPHPSPGEMLGRNHCSKVYVLKEPIAVTQWARSTIEQLEQALHMALDNKEQQLESTAGVQSPGTSSPRGSSKADRYASPRPSRSPLSQTKATGSASPAVSVMSGGSSSSSMFASPGSGFGSASDSKEFLSVTLCKLNGLRTILMALMQRLLESSDQISSSPTKARDETELKQLCDVGMRNLLEMLYQIQQLSYLCRLLRWMDAERIGFAMHQLEEMYAQKQSLKHQLAHEFASRFPQVGLEQQQQDQERRSKQLLIASIMEMAKVSTSDTVCPPTSLHSMWDLWNCDWIHQDFVDLYGREMKSTPVESYFRVPSALMLYFAMDMAFLSERKSGLRPKTLATHLVHCAESFAVEMNINKEMKNMISAIWFVENGYSQLHQHDADEFFDKALDCFQLSLAASGSRFAACSSNESFHGTLETPVLLHLMETLLHSGRFALAWQVWTLFEGATDESTEKKRCIELVVVALLQLGDWEHAWSVLRQAHRWDLLSLLFQWQLDHKCIQHVIQHASLDRSNEESHLETFLMRSQSESNDILDENEIKKVDLLVMYFVLRQRYHKAWKVHKTHLRMIRAQTHGDTGFAAQLDQSLQVRVSLLQSVCPEPLDNEAEIQEDEDVAEPLSCQSVSRSKPASKRLEDTEMLVLPSSEDSQQPMSTSSSRQERQEEEEQTRMLLEDIAPRTSETSTTRADEREPEEESSAEYSPGIYSSRSSQPRGSTSTKKKKPRESLASTTQKTPHGSQGSVSHGVKIGSIDSTPSSRAGRHSFGGRESLTGVTQTLDFGNSPANDLLLARLESTLQKSRSSERPRKGRTPVRFSQSYSRGEAVSPTTEALSLTVRADEMLEDAMQVEDSRLEQEMKSSLEPRDRFDQFGRSRSISSQAGLAVGSDFFGSSQAASSLTKTSTSSITGASTAAIGNRGSNDQQHPRPFEFVQDDLRLATASSPSRTPVRKDDDSVSDLVSPRTRRARQRTAGSDSVRRNPRRSARKKY